MRDLERVDISVVQQHLKKMHTGVSLPESPGEYEAYRAHLEDDDIEKVVLWFEFKVHTTNESCKLVDAKPSSAGEKRITSFIEGNPAKGHSPADLRTSVGMEPVILTDKIESDLLYSIDGNHRLLAQWLSGKSFDGAKVYLCVHPKLVRWPYVPRQFRK